MSVPPFEQRYKIGINKGLMGFFMLSQVVERSSHKILNFERPAFNFLNVYLVNSSFVSLNILEVELLQEVVDGLVHVLCQCVLLAAPVGSSLGASAGTPRMRTTPFWRFHFHWTMKGKGWTWVARKCRAKGLKPRLTSWVTLHLVCTRIYIF